MASFNKYNCFTTDLGLEVHNLNTDTLRVALFTTSHTPAASDTTYGSLSNEVANGNGYTTGGEDVQNAWSDAGSGVATLTGTDIVWTATGAVSNIRYAVMYNDSAGSKNLIGYWDYGASGVSLANGETFTVDFGATILTVT